MFSQSAATLSRDRNLNFNLSETKYVQRLDNQKKKETVGNVRGVKFSSLSSSSSSVQAREKEARSREYDNYINTFTSSSSSSNSSRSRPSSSNKNETKSQSQPGSFRPTGNVVSSVAAMKKANSVESPGRKLLRTPTQEMKD